MKKLITIMLLAVHLFNIGGPLAIYEYLVYQSDELFNTQISKNNYALDDLVEVKLPVNIPTAPGSAEYAYVSGRVEFQHNCYNYVKLKMTRDTLFLMCVPNYKTTRLITMNIIDARKIGDVPVNKKERVPFGKTNTQRILNYYTREFSFPDPGKTSKMARDHIRCRVINSAIARPAQPPEGETLSA